jgi:PAS domain S-box-containing protein
MPDDRTKRVLNLTTYHNFIDHFDDAVIVVDFDCRVLVCNSGAERLFGWLADQIIGQTLPAEAGNKWYEGQERPQLPGGASKPAGWTHRETRVMRDGRETVIEYKASLFKDEQECEVGYLIVAREISASSNQRAERRKFSKLAPKEAREQWIGLGKQTDVLERFLDSLPFCAYVKDEQGRHLFHNRVTIDTAQFCPDSLGKTDEELFGKEAGEKYRETDLQVLTALQPIQTVESLTVGGIERSFLSVKFPIQGAKGCRYLGGISVDITESIRDQAELRKRAELLDLANDAIFVTDLHDQITYWNQGAERLYEYSSAEAIGKTDTELLHAEFSLDRDEIFAMFLQSGHWEGEVTRYRKSGEPLIVSSRWSLLRDLNGEPVARMVINSDLTASKIAYEELRRAEFEAQSKASELAAILEVMPGATFIAHDPRCRTMISSKAAYDLLRLPYGTNSSKSAPEGERPSTFRVLSGGRELAADELPVQRAAATGQPVLDAEVTIAFEDGSSRDILGSAIPLLDSSGTVRGAVGSFIDITERNVALDAVRRQKAILRTVLDSTSDRVFLKDFAGRYLAINPAAARAAGKNPDECIGKDDYEIFPSEIAQRHVERDQAVIASGSSMTFEDETFVDGQTRQIQTVKNVCRDSDGQVIGVVGIARDFTEQKQTENALRKSQGELRSLFESRVIGIGCGDRAGRMSEANDRFLELVGYTRKDFLEGRLRWDQMTPPEYASIDAAGMAQAEQDGSCTPYEKEFIRKDGSRIPILIGYTLEKSSGRFIGFILDLSVQRHAEKALREREERFRALAESLPQLVWTADAKGNKTYCNQRYLEYTNLPSVAAMNASWHTIVHPEDSASAVQLWNHSLETGEPYLKEYRLRRNDGVYRHHLARAVPLRSETGQIEQWLGSITDIHDQKLGEEVLRRTEKLAATGRLAASLAHEINNPLAAISNILYLALQDENLSDGTRKYLKLAEHELARVANVTTQTLRFHKQTGRAASADLCDIMNSALTVFAPRFQDRSISVERDFGTHQKIYCHDTELRQAFANLLSNSLDAMTQGGRLRIRIRLARAWDSTGTRGIRVVVADTGCGIPRDMRSQIFEPFVSAKEATSTGLGLWVTDGIVRNHHGSIRFRSTTNAQRHGTVFSLFLPFIGFTE